MSETDTAADEQRGPGRYEIRIKGHLDPRWSDWFDGMALTREENGETLLAGPVADQAALHGLLRKVRDLGLPLISLILLDPERASRPNVHTDTDSSNGPHVDQDHLGKATD